MLHNFFLDVNLDYDFKCFLVEENINFIDRITK